MQAERIYDFGILEKHCQICGVPLDSREGIARRYAEGEALFCSRECMQIYEDAELIAM